MKKTSVKRMPHSVFSKPSFSASSKPQDYRDIHTHPDTPYEALRGIPSFKDVWKLMEKPEVKTGIVAQIDAQTGKVKGYVFMRKSKAWKEAKFQVKMQKYAEDRLKTEGASYWYGDTPSEDIEDWKNELKRAGIRYRFVPARGYEFDRSEGRFDKKEDIKSRNNLKAEEHRKYMDIASRMLRPAYAFVSALMLLASFFFLSSNITGYAIAGLNANNSNIFGAMFFVAGIIAGYFFMKR